MLSQVIRTRLGKIAQVLSMALVAVWMVGQILRDRNWWMGLMFYFPTPVLVAWLVLLLCVFRNRRRFYIVLLIAPTILLFGVEHLWFRPQLPAKSLSSPAESGNSVPFDLANDPVPMRLVHWNVARGAMGWEQQWRHVESLSPDIIVLSEVPEPFDQSLLTGFDVLMVDCMMVACRGSMAASGTLIRQRVLNAYHVTCNLPDGPLELMVADMTSNIMMPRDPYLRPFVALLAERKIDISVGDFNAPRRSLAFSDLPNGFQHAYDAVGTGWSCTWPVPVPVLAIDQCITGIRIKPLRYKLQSTLLSDHRLQILDFKIERRRNSDPAEYAK